MPALTGSGQISFDDIRIQLGIPSQSPFTLASASLGLYVAINTSSPSKPNASAPHSISEWYGYDHNYVVCYDQSLAYDFSSELTACGNIPNSYDSDTATVNYGTVLYVDATSCTVEAASGYYAESGTSWYYFNGSTVTSNGSC